MTFEFPLADRAEQLRAERDLLSKADADIDLGRNRLREQTHLLSDLEAVGRTTGQAEWLVRLTRDTLVEWERHRRLIEQRIAYLEKEVSRTRSSPEIKILGRD
jgi:hypothetical protein